MHTKLIIKLKLEVVEGKTLQVRPLEVQKADCERNLVAFGIFDMILNAILCVEHFCSFGAMLCNGNLLVKTDSTVFYLCSLYA